MLFIYELQHNVCLDKCWQNTTTAYFGYEAKDVATDEATIAGIVDSAL